MRHVVVSLTTVCCLQLVEQCEDEELMDVVLPRLTKFLSVWELLLAKVHTHIRLYLQIHFRGKMYNKLVLLVFRINQLYSS